MTDNDYVATATAEKRLREVLAERFGGSDGIDGGELAYRVGDVLLAVAEITYLPRKKSVSITLRIPETATAAPSKVLRQDGSDPTVINPNGSDVPAAESATLAPSPRVARFGEFVPTATTTDDDYFTE